MSPYEMLLNNLMDILQIYWSQITPVDSGYLAHAYKPKMAWYIRGDRDICLFSPL